MIGELVVAHDLSWAGWGWCSAHAGGPIAVGHVSLGGRSWRWPAVLDYLNGPIATAITDLDFMRGADDPRIRQVVEEPPAVYSSGGRGAPGKGPPRGAGNQSATCYALGTLSGAVQLWGEARGDLAYPWLVTPMEWRQWWKVGGKGRLEKKQSAVRLVRMLGWGKHLDAFAWDPKPEAAGGAQGDVAEAILLAVGSAKRPELAPKGPAQRRLIEARSGR